jgi:hypothetical protein
MSRPPTLDPAAPIVNAADCTCYHNCEQDSHSGAWHQHEDEPCPVHLDAETVG